MIGKGREAWKAQGVLYTLAPLDAGQGEIPKGTPDAFVFPNHPIYPTGDLKFCNGSPLMVDFKTAIWDDRTWFQRLTDRVLDIFYRLFPPSGFSR